MPHRGQSPGRCGCRVEPLKAAIRPTPMCSINPRLHMTAWNDAIHQLYEKAPASFA